MMSSRASGALCIGMCVALSGASWSARVEAQAKDKAAAWAEASALFNEGVKAAKASRWERARTFYLSAWRVQHHWTIAGSLGRVEFKVGRARDAAEHLSFFLREGSGLSREVRAEAEAMLGEARAKVGALEITVSAPGADVLVDDVIVGTSPLAGPVFVEPGPRTIEVRLDGYERGRDLKTARAGETIPVKLELAKALAPPAGTPPAGTPPGAKAPVEVTRPKKGWVIGGTLGTVALAGAGAALAGVAYAKRRDSYEWESCCVKMGAAERKRRFDDMQLQQAVMSWGAVAAFAGAAALGTVTVVYALGPRKQARSAAGRLVVGPDGARAVISTEW